MTSLFFSISNIWEGPKTRVFALVEIIKIKKHETCFWFYKHKHDFDLQLFQNTFDEVFFLLFEEPLS